MKLKKHQYLIIAFIEGIAVMSCEFLGAKIMAPFYGTSLFVWTSVIGVTMISLSLGYYIGGILSERHNVFRILLYSIWGGSSGLLIMPFLAPRIMLFSLDMGIYTGSVFSSLLLISPTLVCFSMINPLLIKLAVGGLNKSGNITGNVYAVSTIGAIFATLFLGFYIIPNWGIKSPVWYIVMGLLLFLFVLTHKFLPANKNKRKYYPVAILLLITILFSKYYFSSTEPFKQHKIIYESEGLLGQ
ncbi:fused MFS/spermidine synthase, partial [bacterium AH-315-M05]|nr:fused MFS/spermidine synthase [bacterium AH-315-M05]